MGLQRLLAEPGADLTYRLVLLRVGVVAREQERAVDVRALALAVVRPDDDEVERVADPGEVVFLELRIRGVCVSYKRDGTGYSRQTLSQFTRRRLGS